MMLFNGDHKDTKVTGTVNGKNFFWKIDTGSTVTCMNISLTLSRRHSAKQRRKNKKTSKQTFL